MSISKTSGGLCFKPTIEGNRKPGSIIYQCVDEVKREMEKNSEQWEVLAEKIEQITTCLENKFETGAPTKQVRRWGWGRKRGYHIL